MCGIFGIVGSTRRDGLRDAALTLRHRGPDGFGEWWSDDPSVYMAHCRLAIIDLSEAARQPMPNEDGTVLLTFNGEVYNFRELREELLAAGHRFRSQSDTEVIVHGYEQWGDPVVGRLRGIFAFALWDQVRCRLLLARDRLGVKPLYYTVRGKNLAFASETRALLACGAAERAIDPGSALQFLRHSYITGPNTIWAGIARLPPATTLAFDARRGTVETQRYWRPGVVDDTWTMPSAVTAADAILGDAVREELVSDVPVGVFLSGGIDSSLVSAYAAAASPSINSFFVDFAGWKGSERGDSAEVARHLGTSHHVCEVDSEAMQLDEPAHADELFASFDEPLGDPAIIPTWHLSRLMRQHVTVALSGDGGDELFGGYRWYRDVRATSRRRASWAVEKLRRAIGVGREWPRGCEDQREYYHLLHCPAFTRDELVRLFPSWQREAADLRAGIGNAHPGDAGADSERHWRLTDLDTYLVDNNLARVDRASMAHGLEVRVPLLNPRVAEFALSLPAGIVGFGESGKPLLRRLAASLLPGRTRAKAKQGFSFPLQHYISEAAMAEAVRGGVLARAGTLDARALGEWFDAAEGSNHAFKLWLLFVLEQWARHWLCVASAAGSTSTAAVEAAA